MKKLFFITCLLFSEFLFSQHTSPLYAKDAKSQKKWVDSLLQSMTINQKIGQLFMIQAYSNKGKKHQKTMVRMIQKYHIGGLIFMQGSAAKQAELTNLYQSMTRVPLLIGIDAEWGLAMRLKNGYRFPWNMTLGAIRDNLLITQFGVQLARHCKRLGVQLNFAPVVDINTNPKNPIIGNRSFGEDKKQVAQKAVAFIKGMQSVGVLSCAKHFPGHGDTATDSHKTLPVVNFDEQRLDSVELYPYKKIFKKGVTAVMTAHLSIPKIVSDPKLPSSLSKRIVTDLLQKRLGFSGLVITDALNMKGASNYNTAAKINLAAFLAGNDILLIPQDIPNTVKRIKQALKRGVLTQNRIDYSVRKILMAKYLAGLHHHHLIKITALQQDLNKVADEVLHRKLVKNALTLLKNGNAIIPVKNLKDKKVAYVKLGDASGNNFVNTLQKYTDITPVSDKNLKRLLKKLTPYNLVVIGFHKSNANPWKDYQFTSKELVWLQAIAENKEVILTVFASPYSLLQIKSFANIEAVLVSYQNSSIAQQLSAQAIFGAIDIKGQLPVSVGNIFRRGRGLIIQNIKRLQYGLPESVGMSSKKLKVIDIMADSIIRQKMAPGMQILVARYGKVIYNKSFGYHTYRKRQKVVNTDIYDLASLTKIMATLPLVMKAIEDHKLTLEEQLQQLLPYFKNSNKDTITVKEMLSHFARLKAWIPFYKKTQDTLWGSNLPQFYRYRKTGKYQIEVAKNLYLDKNYKDSIYKYIKVADQRKKLEYKYSDLGFFLFKKFLAQTYHKPLNVLVEEKFYKSLGANRMTYLPLQKFPSQEIVPTEKDTYFRHQLLIGYVHDMGAAMQGGVGGHAGLFANANDVAKMMQLYLQKGQYGGRRYLKTTTINTFNKRYYADKKVRRGLGFDKPQLNPEIKNTCGCVSDQSFGHSGFTGTYTWADPESGILYVFLSNRVYPIASNTALIDKDMRTKIQQLIQKAIITDTMPHKQY